MTTKEIIKRMALLFIIYFVIFSNKKGGKRTESFETKRNRVAAYAFPTTLPDFLASFT